MSRVSAPSNCSRLTVLMKSSVLDTRALSSSRVASVSACLGTSRPANRAAAPLAVSQAIWIWLDRGSMSTMRRVAGNTLGSTFLPSAWLAALSRIAARLFRVSVNIGMDTSYRETDMQHLRQARQGTGQTPARSVQSQSGRCQYREMVKIESLQALLEHLPKWPASRVYVLQDDHITAWLDPREVLPQ